MPINFGCTAGGCWDVVIVAALDATLVVLEADNAVAALDVALFLTAASFSLGARNNAAQLDGLAFGAASLFTGDDAVEGAGDGVGIPLAFGADSSTVVAAAAAVDTFPLGLGVVTVVTGADAGGVGATGDDNVVVVEDGSWIAGGFWWDRFLGRVPVANGV